MGKYFYNNCRAGWGGEGWGGEETARPSGLSSPGISLHSLPPPESWATWAKMVTHVSLCIN